MNTLLTTREVAELLAVAPETVLRRVRAGQLPAIRLASNALRFRESEIEAFLERLESAQPPSSPAVDLRDVTSEERPAAAAAVKRRASHVV